MRREGGKICWRSVSRGGKRGGNPEKRLPAAGRGDHITIASRGGRDCATVHVSHEKLFGIYFGEYSEDIFSSKGTKKILPERGNARFSASRPLRQDHGSGSGFFGGEGAVPFLSVLTSSTTVREPPHRPFPCPSDSPPRPHRKHRPCLARVR